METLQDAHDVMERTLSSNVAPHAFGMALLCAGQLSTFTGTISGQVPPSYLFRQCCAARIWHGAGVHGAAVHVHGQYSRLDDPFISFRQWWWTVKVSQVADRAQRLVWRWIDQVGLVHVCMSAAGRRNIV